MTTKNTMIRPCAVMTTFHSWPSVMYCRPGVCSSMRMKTEARPPMTAAIIENARYIVPMSLWFVE